MTTAVFILIDDARWTVSPTQSPGLNPDAWDNPDAWEPGVPLYNLMASVGHVNNLFVVYDDHDDGNCTLCGDDDTGVVCECPECLESGGWRWSPDRALTEEDGVFDDLVPPTAHGIEFYGATVIAAD